MTYGKGILFLAADHGGGELIICFIFLALVVGV